MRAAVLCLLGALACLAQFRSTVPLVVAPTTVRDANGNFVDGLDTPDLILYDNNVPRPAQVGLQAYPISLVVCVETRSDDSSILDKLGGSGILFSQLIAADRGETALLSFNDRVSKQVDFTTDPDKLTGALKKLRAKGDSGAVLDALELALRMLALHPAGRRPVILMIAETRDRGSESRLEDVVLDAQRQNVAIYWLSYSTFLAPYFDHHVKTDSSGTILPAEYIPWDLLAGIRELAHLSNPAVSRIFTGMSGGREIGFRTRRGVEEAVHAVGEEIHRQYILTFQPPGSTSGLFHRIRVEVKGRPELRATTREGYWVVD